MQLTTVEVRVIGALIEKELTTPQYYPLTLNALTAACNQTSNRNPILNLDETVIRTALDDLKDKGLARIVHSPSNRAVKFRQVIHEVFGLTREELAVVGVLMLRGPQTVGELRSRTERMVTFAGLDDVDEVVTRLGEKVEPLAVRVERQPGQKEGRVAHLLGEVDPRDQPTPDPIGAPDEPHRHWVDAPTHAESPPVRELEEAVAALRDEVAELRAELDALRRDLGA